MKMRALGVLALVTALMAVVVYAVREPAQPAVKRLLPGFDVAAVAQIDITRSGRMFSLSRVAEGSAFAWRLLPAGVRADEHAVRDLLSTIDFAEAARTADLTPAAAGLSPPAVTVAIATAPGVRPPPALHFGRPDPGGLGVYVAVEGTQGVRVGPKRVLDLADRDPNAFRDRRVVVGAPTKVTWRLGDGQRHGIFTAPEGWQNGRGEKVDDQRVAEALRRIGALRIASYGSVPSGTEATRGIRTVADEVAEIAVADAGGVIVNGEGATLQSPELLAGIWQALAAAEARDDGLVSAPAAAITSVELQQGPRRLKLAREPGGWKFEGPKPPYDADSAAIEAWLGELLELKAPQAAKAGSGRRLVVQARTQQIVDLPPGSPGYPLLDPDPLRFRNRALLDISPIDIRRLRRSQPGVAAAEARRGDDQTWQPVGPALDTAKLAELVETLATLRAASFADKAPTGRPELTIEIDVGAPHEKPARHTVEIHAGCRGRLDRTTSFTLDAETCADLRGDLLPTPN